MVPWFCILWLRFSRKFRNGLCLLKLLLGVVLFSTICFVSTTRRNVWMLVIWYTSGKLRCFEPLCFKALCHGKFLIFKVRANFVWPWNENVRTTQKHQTNGNRAIWLVYRTDTNARGFWLVKRTLGWKNFMPENFLEINWYFALTSYCNSIGQSNNAFSIVGVLWRENEEAMFGSFHPLADNTNNEHLTKPFFKVIRKSLWLALT